MNYLIGKWPPCPRQTCVRGLKLNHLAPLTVVKTLIVHNPPTRAAWGCPISFTFLFSISSATKIPPLVQRPINDRFLLPHRTWNAWPRPGWMNSPSTFISDARSTGTCPRGTSRPRRSCADSSSARTSNGSWRQWPGMCLSTTLPWSPHLQPGERWGGPAFTLRVAISASLGRLGVLLKPSSPLLSHQVRSA